MNKLSLALAGFVALAATPAMACQMMQPAAAAGGAARQAAAPGGMCGMPTTTVAQPGQQPPSGGGCSCCRNMAMMAPAPSSPSMPGTGGMDHPRPDTTPEQPRP